MDSPRHLPQVFIVDNSPSIRERIVLLLQANDMRIVGQAATSMDAIQGILSGRPDVAVLDVQLGNGSGLQVMRAVKAKVGTAFVIFSHNNNPVYRRRYLEEGAVRFLDKSTDVDQLAQAVQQAWSAGAGSSPGA
jgi:DNA-binding NarL/FixJ family response regulator